MKIVFFAFCLFLPSLGLAESDSTEVLLEYIESENKRSAIPISTEIPLLSLEEKEKWLTYVATFSEGDILPRFLPDYSRSQLEITVSGFNLRLRQSDDQEGNHKHYVFMRESDGSLAMTLGTNCTDRWMHLDGKPKEPETGNMFCESVYDALVRYWIQDLNL